MKKAFILILTPFLILPVLSQSADEQRLRSAMESGCLTNGSLKLQIITGKIYYKKESVQQPGKMVRFYADMTFEFEDGSNSGKWKCPQLNGNSSNSSSSSSDAAVALFLGMLESSSGSSNNSSSFTDRTPSLSNSTMNSNNSCSKCSQSWTIRDYDEYTKQYSNFRKETKFGFIPCSQCQGTKKMSVTAGSSYIGKVCTLCKGNGWIKCTSGNH